MVDPIFTKEGFLSEDQGLWTLRQGCNGSKGRYCSILGVVRTSKRLKAPHFAKVPAVSPAENRADTDFINNFIRRAKYGESFSIRQWASVYGYGSAETILEIREFLNTGEGKTTITSRFCEDFQTLFPVTFPVTLPARKDIMQERHERLTASLEKKRSAAQTSSAEVLEQLETEKGRPYAIRSRIDEIVDNELSVLLQDDNEFSIGNRKGFFVPGDVLRKCMHNISLKLEILNENKLKSLRDDFVSGLTGETRYCRLSKLTYMKNGRIIELVLAGAENELRDDFFSNISGKNVRIEIIE